jgi:hypothetical protein
MHASLREEVRMGLLGSVPDATGTYVKVVRFAQPSNPDGIIVLYLRPHGRFLMAGYWRRYEQSVAAGDWVLEGEECHLRGYGTASADSQPEPGSRPFTRIFRREVSHFTPTLVAADGLENWSLLGWAGSYAYVGEGTVFDPDGRWLPASLQAVDEMIERIYQKPEGA